MFRVILEHLTNLADGGVNAVVGIKEDVFSPYPLDNLVSADELPALLD